MKKLTYLLIASLSLTTLTGNNQLRHPTAQNSMDITGIFLKNIQKLLKSGTQTLR
jgi:hypothetical protein